MKQRIVKQITSPHTEDTGSDSDLLLNFVTGTINAYIKFGGSLVPEEQYQERVKTCSGCDYAGDVKIPLIVKALTVPGCTLCGCPFETKPRALKYFSFEKLSIIPATCPHPDGSLWEVIDKKFL